MSYWKNRNIRNLNFKTFQKESINTLLHLGILPTLSKQPKSEIIYSIPITIYNEITYDSEIVSKLVELTVVRNIRKFLHNSGLQPKDILFELNLKQTHKHFFLVHFIQGELILYPNNYRDNCTQMMRYLLEVNSQLKQKLDLCEKELAYLKGINGSNL